MSATSRDRHKAGHDYSVGLSSRASSDGARAIQLPSSARLHSPRGHWALGHIPAVRRDPLGFLLRTNARCGGGVIQLRLRGPTHLLYDPPDIQQVLVTHQRHYHKDSTFKRTSRSVFGEGLLLSEDAFHLRQRHLMQPAFHKQSLQGYASAMVSCSLTTSSGWTEGAAVDLFREMTRLTLAIVAKALFGLEEIAETQALGEAVDVAQQYTFAQQAAIVPLPEAFPTPLHRQYRKAVSVMDRITYQVLKERRANPASGTPDLVTLLLMAQYEDGTTMDAKQLRDEVLTLLLAGHETTANALSWSWYLLARHPEVEERLLREFDQVLGGRPPTVEDFGRLPYAEQFLAEVLRLYPPAWIIPRQVHLEDRLSDGIVLPAGTQVLTSPWATHRDPRFFPDPERFDPDRFTSARREAMPPFAYFPFGGGTRRCIGEHFAKMEAVLVLATLVPRWKVNLQTHRPVTPQPLVTLRPLHGLPARLSSRTGLPSS